ncbi:alpha/beta hydrolase [Brevundimonas sp.]|uniref:alpha/beta hydrolase n=1 Tax=Brevundimonas sp. TaxID=1871086 RepID=UPI002737BAE4|nr:alpha/beta hydrolase [Brevundimonas sp.]MDP3803137.1 alpha/beta hydrolase [Brevundimonas sp.]
MLTSRRALLTLALAAGLAPSPVLAQRAAATARAVSFGSHPLQTLDLYPGAESGPVLLFVHGGGWSRGERSMVHDLPAYATRHGLTLASTSYRLVPEVSAREAAEDVAAAVARLKRDLPGRPLFLLGHSAGAHLAALVGVDPVYLGAHGLAPADIAGVILLDGAGYDATGDRGPGIVGRALDRRYEQAFGADAAALSPTLRVESGRAYPPYLIFHIGRRQDSAAHSRALAEALVRAGGRAEVAVAPDDSHRDINVGFGGPGDPEGVRAARFISAES